MSLGALEGIEFRRMPPPSQTRAGGATGSGTSRAGRAWRLLGYAAAAAAVIAAGTFATRWAHYRLDHVVSTHAEVKGIIANLGARLDGVVTRHEAQPGRHVRQGDVLARMDDRPYQADLLRARSELQRATETLAVERLAIEVEDQRLDLKVDEADGTLAMRTARLAAAEAAAVRARKEHDRQIRLERDDVTSDVELRDAVEALDTAEALVIAARAEEDAARAAARRARIERDGLSVRRANLKVLEATVEVARSRIAGARADIEAMLIRAPEDGWVVRHIVESGGSVRTGQPILTFRCDGRLWIEAWIDEGDLAHIAVGSPATVTVEPYTDRVRRGHVESIGVLTDGALDDAERRPNDRPLIRDTAKVMVRVAIDDPDKDLIPGLSAAVGITRRDDDGMASAPSPSPSPYP